jgi:hypothetical protein
MIAKHAGNCPAHLFQDSRYGKGFRVMNPVFDKGKIVGARCTVCCPPKTTGSKRGGIYSLDQLQIRR